MPNPLKSKLKSDKVLTGIDKLSHHETKVHQHGHFKIGLVHRNFLFEQTLEFRVVKRVNNRDSDSWRSVIVRMVGRVDADDHALRVGISVLLRYVARPVVPPYYRAMSGDWRPMTGPGFECVVLYLCLEVIVFVLTCITLLFTTLSFL